MGHESSFTRLLSGLIYFRDPRAGIDEVIAGLAGLQNGVVARQQLLDLGVSRDAIEYRIRCGRLRRLYAGGARAVYAVGHEALPLTARATAGTLAAGPGSAASHWTALALRGLLERQRPLIHVTHPLARRQHRGLLIHRAVLPSDEVELVEGIPSTTVPRTCLDLSGAGNERELRSIIKRAEFKRLLTADDIVEILARYQRRRGRKALARIAARYALTAGPTLSPIEDDFAEFCGERGIPLGEANVPIVAGGVTRVIDRLYREERLAVELDGRDAHERRLAFEDDRERDRALTAAGWRPVRITSAQLTAGAEPLERDLRRLLGIDARSSARTGAA